MRFDHVLGIARPTLIELIKKWLHPNVRILVVVDTEIELLPGANAFGIERVIRLLRDSTIGCMSFTVDVGLRSSGAFSVVAAPAGTEAKYLGFRFDSSLPDGSKVIDHYDEVWCFGFKPDNTNGADSRITQAFAIPATDQELAALTIWMNAGGGVFATGDHDYLGASMCHRIPRVGTMRAWTNAQGVPPIGTQLRIDTNRAANAAEEAGTEVIEFNRQGDAVPQPIEWVPWMSYLHPWYRRYQRPHPVLCHPTLGPIDVMPDHPHEGVVFDHVAQPDVGLAPITLTNTYSFVGTTGPEYPTSSGVQPLPMVIAYGRTLADPPYWHEKGDSPAKRFAMISVYDGHRASVGRVAADSTWHHWMNVNITNLESAGGANWEKIKRYYLNLAVWLAPAAISRRCFCIHLVESFYAYPGIEEFHAKGRLLEIGTSLRRYLALFYGPCWVSQLVIDWIGVADFKLRERLIERYFVVPLPKGPFPPRPDPCLTCPPLDILEAAVLGGVVRAAAQLLHADGATVEASLKRAISLDALELEKHALKGAVAGLQELRADYARSMKETERLFG